MARKRMAGWIALIGLVPIGRTTGAIAADFTVNTTTDAVDAVAGDGLCASPAGECTLRAAVQEANALPGTDGIALPAGIYALAISGAGEDASTSGDLDVTSDLAITGVAAGSTIVDAAALDRVFSVRSGATVAISDLTIRNGAESGSAGGGGIAIQSGALTLQRSTVTGNTTTGLGGGIGSLGSVTLVDSAVTANRSDAGAGGIASTGPVSLTRTTVSDNVSEAGPGGVACCGSGDVTVVDSMITGNTGGGIGGGGGGISLVATTATVTNTTVSGNSIGTEGGGIFVLDGATATVLNSTVADNTAGADGGGIWSSGTTTINSSVISGNSANPEIGLGGGAHNAGTMTVTGSRVSGNSAFLLGGLGNVGTLIVIGTDVNGNRAEGVAEFIAGSGIGQLSGAMTVIGTTISGNETPHGTGGGIGAFGDVTVRGSTISNNSVGGLTGGGFAVANGSLDIANSTISGNSIHGIEGGVGGGGIASSVPTILTNVTISGNGSASNGGGISSAGQLTLNNVTITNNTADSDGDGRGDGGGISTAGEPVTLSNTIIADNADVGGEKPDCNNTALLSQGYNLIGNTSSCPFTPGPGDISGEPADLGPLAYHGGATQTHAPLAGSPAIDAGSPEVPGSGAPACEATDQRGMSRPEDGDANGEPRCDIGAFELPEPKNLSMQLAGAVAVFALARRRSRRRAPVKAGDQAMCG